MNVEEQIEQYISEQPVTKRMEMQALHQLILGFLPESTYIEMYVYNQRRRINRNAKSQRSCCLCA